jgi:hypothetical protein
MKESSLKNLQDFRLLIDEWIIYQFAV